MTNEQIKEQLREIVNTPTRQITAEQKSSIVTIAAELGVQVNPKKNCGTCWHEAAMQILEHMKQAETPATDETRKYILKQGVDLFFGDIRVNENTLTDDLARKIIARGFELKYFAKCE